MAGDESFRLAQAVISRWPEPSYMGRLQLDAETLAERVAELRATPGVTDAATNLVIDLKSGNQGLNDAHAELDRILRRLGVSTTRLENINRLWTPSSDDRAYSAADATPEGRLAYGATAIARALDAPENHELLRYLRERGVDGVDMFDGFRTRVHDTFATQTPQRLDVVMAALDAGKMLGQSAPAPSPPFGPAGATGPTPGAFGPPAPILRRSINRPRPPGPPGSARL